MTDPVNDDKAPIFHKWNYWYVLVIGFLLVLVILFIFFTREFQ